MYFDWISRTGKKLFEERSVSKGSEWQFHNEQTSETPGFDIRSIIWERKWLLLFFGMLGVALGYLEYMKQPPVYRSSAAVLVDRYQPQVPIGAMDTVGIRKDPLNTHVVLFQTPVILKRAVEDYRLGELASLNHTDPMGAIAKGLHVNRPLSGNDRHLAADDILQLSFTCGDAKDSQRVLEAVIASYFHFLDESQRSTSVKTVELINEAKNELSQSLQKKEQSYQEFREKSTLLWTGDQGQNIHQSRLAQIEGERSSLLIKSSQIRAELDAINKAIESGTSRQALLIMADQARQRAGENSTEAAQGSITSQLIPLMLEESMLLDKLGSQHPKVTEVRRRIEVTRTLLSDAAGELENSAQPVEKPDLLTLYTQSLQEELRMNQEKIQSLDNLFLHERQASGNLAMDENQNRMLKEDLERTKGLFDVVVQKLQELSLVNDKVQLTAKVVNHPSVGSEIRTKMFNYAGMGGMGGLLVGALIGLLLELNDKRFRSPEEMMQMVGVPILGHIPEMSIRRNPKKELNSEIDPTVANFHTPKSRIAESYRLIRNSMLMNCKTDKEDGQGVIIQFTSPDPGDGKTTTCSNIAVAIANSGKRILVIDLDLRRPTVHKMLGVSRDIGVSTILTEDVEWADCIQSTKVPNLDAMTAGKQSEQMSELLHSPKLKQLLETLRQTYDVILLDSPPVLAVADAAAIVPLADSLILVVKNTKHSRPHVKQARENLDLVSARISGIVVNCISEETGYRYEAGQYRRGVYNSGYNYSRNYAYNNRRYSYYYENSDA